MRNKILISIFIVFSVTVLFAGCTKNTNNRVKVRSLVTINGKIIKKNKIGNVYNYTISKGITNAKIKIKLFSKNSNLIFVNLNNNLIKPTIFRFNDTSNYSFNLKNIDKNKIIEFTFNDVKNYIKIKKGPITNPSSFDTYSQTYNISFVNFTNKSQTIWLNNHANPSDENYWQPSSNPVDQFTGSTSYSAAFTLQPGQTKSESSTTWEKLFSDTPAYLYVSLTDGFSSSNPPALYLAFQSHYTQLRTNWNYKNDVISGILYKNNSETVRNGVPFEIYASNYHGVNMNIHIIIGNETSLDKTILEVYKHLTKNYYDAHEYSSQGTLWVNNAWQSAVGSIALGWMNKLFGYSDYGWNIANYQNTRSHNQLSGTDDWGWDWIAAKINNTYVSTNVGANDSINDLKSRHNGYQKFAIYDGGSYNYGETIGTELALIYNLQHGNDIQPIINWLNTVYKPIPNKLKNDEVVDGISYVDGFNNTGIHSKTIYPYNQGAMIFVATLLKKDNYVDSLSQNLQNFINGYYTLYNTKNTNYIFFNDDGNNNVALFNGIGIYFVGQSVIEQKKFNGVGFNLIYEAEQNAIERWQNNASDMNVYQTIQTLFDLVTYKAVLEAQAGYFKANQLWWNN